MHLVQSLDKMSDIHSTITTTSGYLFYQLVSFAWITPQEVSANIFNCSVWKCTQGQMEAVPCDTEKALCWFRVDGLLS